LDELAHFGVPVVEHPLHVGGNLRRIDRRVDVVVAALVVVDLFFSMKPVWSKRWTAR
jgi:hypothetical protein